ncbi:hypothetical protein PUNSTDRAFT_143697 [Punctularia strigosozonata HHB-11173 SS5]|uniref:uncharacterized protein n=1 Tax=Punctularia strigosozonata (strain HHB-11173) TaxID=741275 RepID=UPI0004416295|nr:uncharacterized protein PUNSTDRAFT_143697 [Punctularia strigosozonata HHB-11173 SS5]EIN09082.1 hypothetical protein PUNSTDRAFT_143697 [Punctularia strigosozonata HHB-11173 SS5]
METAIDQEPHTPSRRQFFQPTNSSPLASTSSPPLPKTSYRRAQYKATAPGPRTPTPGRPRATPGSAFARAPLLLESPVDQGTQKAFLRERFKKRCFERAARARERRVEQERRRASSNFSSDGDYSDHDMDEEVEEDPDEQLYDRIMTSLNSRQRHQYRLSYAYEVGSSLDPDMEDASKWESELREPDIIQTTPDDLEEEELREYAAEMAKLGSEYDDLAGVDMEEVFSLSDLDDDMNTS